MEVLKDITKLGKERPWREKKLKTIELANSYYRLGNKKYYRIRECGTYLEYRRYLETQELRLNRSNFCKVRLCPMCSWRRSLKIFGQTSKVMNKALEEKEYRFLFLTLTCKNVDGEDLSSQIDELFKAFTKMTRRKIFKQPVKGWFRALEVTHNLDKTSDNYDTYHPHFHMVLMVNKSYFDDNKLYISHEKWVELWKSCMGVDYDPIVILICTRNLVCYARRKPIIAIYNVFVPGIASISPFLMAFKLNRAYNLLILCQNVCSVSKLSTCPKRKRPVLRFLPLFSSLPNSSGPDAECIVSLRLHQAPRPLLRLRIL